MDATRVDMSAARRFDCGRMKLGMALALALWCAAAAFAREQPAPKLLTKVQPLPVALDPDFQFRKTKLYFLSEKARTESKHSTGSGRGSGDSQSSSSSRSRSTSAVQDASINFERNYRLFGAVTKLDQRERYGDYLDFFWRAKRPADVTVRLEYQQDKLHAHTQAQEVSLHGVRGTQKTDFKVIGDDYADNGRIIAWRCVLIVDGKIVAENHSFMWRG